jgi:glutamate-5-semialdehyde dehydrogenase
MSELAAHVDDLCARARPAARILANLPDAARVAGLRAVAEAILARQQAILAANALDLAAGRAAGLPAAMLDRLMLDPQRLNRLAGDVLAVAAQSDPVGRVLEERRIAQDLRCRKLSVPIGVVCIIYESRPNVTADTAALCLRSGNACILRGGKEAAHSNAALADAVAAGLADAGLPADAVQLVRTSDRALLPLLLKRDDAIDIVVPRGGEGLIRAVVEMSRIPVVKHDKGLCSLYVHRAADRAMATAIALNAKMQRPGVCNAIETLYVDRAVLASHLGPIASALAAAGVQLRADAEALPHCGPTAVPAQPADWDTEFLDLILAVRTVGGPDEAIALTNRHGSHHSDAIVTADAGVAARYLAEIDAACVYHNASTRFTDGGQFGMGAEVGISTNRLHARGPMGIAELCTYKFVVEGTGQVR